jgi:hypothetical protein
MADVMVTAWANGDGWLTVDTQEWICDRAEYSDQLTEDLRNWMEEQGHRDPTAEVLVMWAKSRTGAAPVGLHGDGTCWVHNTCNVTNLLFDDIGFVVFTADGDLGSLMITISDELGCYGMPTVYRSTVDDLESWADYDRASGWCPGNHEWHVTCGGLLYAESPDSFDTPAVTRQARVPDGDRNRAYIACPDCGRALHFVA